MYNYERKILLMNYNETIQYLFKQLPVYENIGGRAYKPGLDNALALDKIFNSPHLSFNTIHVGGTNGKGSVSHTLAAILQSAGYKVGLYTSPHLIDFKERIRTNGSKISEKYIVDFVSTYREKFEPIGCSFFELTMMLSFCYFRDEKVDIAIIEVGLGGRLDSTNIISPLLSIITNIGYDHTQYLGNSRKEIAYEKAGIIKPYTPVVIGEVDEEIRDVFLELSKNNNAPITFASENTKLQKAKMLDGAWHYITNENIKFTGDLRGIVQVKNTNTILNSLEILSSMKFKITPSSIIEGFSNVTSLTGLLGRWQIISENPRIICDTAHNVSGFEYISQQLSNENYETLHIVIGMANDKDVNEILILLPPRAKYYFVNAQTERAMKSNILKNIGKEYSLEGDSYNTVKEGFEDARENATSNDLIFIGGSNFVVGEFLALHHYN